MLDLQSPASAASADEDLSLHDFLAFLRRQRRLGTFLLQALAEKRVVAAARQAGLSVSPEDLQRAASLLRYRNGLISAEQTRRRLDNQWLSTEDFEQMLEQELLADKLARHLADDRLVGYFEEHRDRYARARLRMLVIAAEGVGRELKAHCEEEGKDFAELAREHSLHGPSRMVGGSIGVLPCYALPAAVAAAVFTAHPGDVVGPLPAEDGFRLFLVEELLPPELDEEARAAIRRELFDAWLGEQMKDVRIDLSWLKTAHDGT
jgi:parvulin-like peptidyl-prolyl isomerase